MIGIYKIENLINNKIYIGQSIDILERWSRHLKANPDSFLHQDFYKYGITNFSFSILEICEKEELDEKEKYWIKYYNSYINWPESNGYNMNEGGWKNYTSPKAKAVLQYDLNGKFVEEFPSTTIASQKTKIDLRSIQSCCANDPKRKTAGGYQWKYKDDSKEIKQFNKRIDYTVLQIDKNTGIVLCEFDSPKQAAKELGINSAGIVNCCNNKLKSSFGYIWKYKN